MGKQYTKEERRETLKLAEELRVAAAARDQCRHSVRMAEPGEGAVCGGRDRRGQPERSRVGGRDHTSVV